jgi:hypothetical protein
MESDIKENPLSVAILAEETEGGWDSTERLPVRLESFGILKQRSDIFTDWAKIWALPTASAREKKVIQSLDVCGSYLIFRQYIEANRTRLIGGCTCKKHLLCALCASRRGVRNTQAYRERFETLQAKNPELEVYFLTFTILNGADLHERYLHLKKSMQALLKKRNHEAANHRGITTEMSKLSGGVFAFEFKRGGGESLWHPHIHMLALLPKGSWIDAQSLKEEWQAITGDSFVLNIRKADSGAFLEVFAYALKFSEMDHPDRWQASQLLRNERLISSFGDVRGVEVDESNSDDLLDADEPYYDLLFNWQSNRYNLLQKTEHSTEMESMRREDAVLRSTAIRWTQYQG